MFINIRELAKLAGVSIATVSRVVNTPELVQPETRAHVLSVMRKVGYAPSLGVKRHSVNRSSAIVFLFNGADYDFYEQIREGLESVLEPRHYTVLLCPVHAEDARRAEEVETVCRQKPDGIIYGLRDFHEDNIRAIQNAGIPLVLIRKYAFASELYDCCYVNFLEGSYRMTRYLIEHGHQKIVLLVEKASFQFVSSFCDGWEKAYRESGLPFDTDWIIHTPNTIEGGYNMALHLLAAKNDPDAFFCASGEMAFGVLRAARSMGIHVPTDLSVVGFTDSAVAELSDPRLTTIDQSIPALGTIAARLLLDQIFNQSVPSPAPQEIVLQPKLQIRESCGSREK